ncbi:uncharacterized protein LOC128508823 isoform X1 [Clarias gariepinus]|uniref:uncharacterized protein LOC128508823 isoform X1 n=1 Tax=Clarias gariepinus TaxID=13013 RepID=UPI00234CF36C|nr:uncharacterized protein LOC128508823 isoform X1 [Clarias gariepinus]
MAENVRSPFDYREPPTLDSDGDGGKPPPPRGRVCGRKRKGTPVKVCDRAYVTEDEEESLSEHSYSPGEGQYPDEAEDRIPPPGSPYYLADPSQLCVPELGEEGASGVRGPVLFPPLPPNCRIREVHCGSQVRLVVIAIRDIAKGEEITVDYNLAEWGENALAFHRSVSPRGFECAFNPDSNIKKEEEAAPSLPLSLTVSDYLTPSWSLSPSSSPLSRSEASDSDRDEDEEEEEDEEEDDEEEEDLEELRGRMMRRRKKRKTTNNVAKKKSQPSPLTFPPSSSPFQSPLAPPTTNINNNININIGRSTSRKQHCPHCGRHFRSLARHLEKHHDQQPEIRNAMELSHGPRSAHTPSTAHTRGSHPFTSPQPSASSSSSSATPNLFSRDSSGSGSAAMSFSLSLSPPSRRAASKKSPASLPTPPRKNAASTAVAVKKSPSPPAKRGRRPKKEKEEKQKKQEEVEQAKEEAPPTPGRNEEEERDEIEDEELDLTEMRDDDSGEEKNGASSHRSHVSPLLSSLSTLVLYLRRQQHSSFLSLSRSSSSAEAWRLLCHSSLALLIIYNRHRECEMAKLTINDYRSRVTPSSNSSSPLEASLSPFERQVLCHRPRVGVLGKRGRVQPLILPPHSESCLDLLLKTSTDVNVDPESPYVFSRPYHSPATPLRGTDLLRGLARASGAKNPAALTSPRTRRQVAILTQLLLMDEGEKERLEHFLHSEYHVTQSCARIGQDPALMGRVGRVVLYGERDGVLFRGMSLKHICLELDGESRKPEGENVHHECIQSEKSLIMSGNSADSFSEESDGEGEKSNERIEVAKTAGVNGRAPPKTSASPVPSPTTPSPSGSHKRRSSQIKSGKRGVLKRPWTEAERVAVETHLKRNIMELRVPAKADCERCLQHCPLLVSNQRDWRAIKFYCHNRIQLLKKQGRG